jgi:hypothetical protein
MRKLLLFAVPALAACNPFPYPKQHHVTIDEIEASSVTAEPGVELHVRMVTEGDFIERCASNLGGTYHAVIGGEAHVCVVPAP